MTVRPIRITIDVDAHRPRPRTCTCGCTCSRTGWRPPTRSTSTASSACSPTWRGPTSARSLADRSTTSGWPVRREGRSLVVRGLDKFPPMTDYVIPTACASPTRPGAPRRPPRRRHRRDARRVLQLQRRHARDGDGGSDTGSCPSAKDRLLCTRGDEGAVARAHRLDLFGRRPRRPHPLRKGSRR